MKEQRKEHKAGVAVKQQKNTEKQQFVLQYRGNIINEFVKRLKKDHPVQTKSCLACLKSSFDKDLKSHLVYELTCNGCKYIYVWQTCRHNTTRIAEHAKVDLPMGKHEIECNVDKTAFLWKILDQCSNKSKLLTLEALYKNTLKPAINTRNEYRTLEVTLKAQIGEEIPT